MLTIHRATGYRLGALPLAWAFWLALSFLVPLLGLTVAPPVTIRKVLAGGLQPANVALAGEVGVPTGMVDNDLAPCYLTAIHLLDGNRNTCPVFECDEAKASAPLRLAVKDHLQHSRNAQFSVLGTQRQLISQARRGGVPCYRLLCQCA